jgi:isocitrate dehydrogenase (NAD+)
MTYRVTLIPGDGIGPEVIAAARHVLDATGVGFEWDVQIAGAEALEKVGAPLPRALLDSIRANGVGLKGPLTTALGTAGFRSVNVGIRQELSLWANLRPVKNVVGVDSRYEHVDLVVVRENTEGMYTGIEHTVIPNQAAEAIRIITRKASERIVRFAFEYARGHGRRKVTAVHKANVLKVTDGLFLGIAQEIATQYPDIAFDHRIVDNMSMQLVRDPTQFDVIVTTNLFGDILSDLCSGLVGGLGLAPGANLGDKLAVFEPVHGSAPKYAGQNKANPTATIMSGVLLLRHLGENKAADRVEDAVLKVIADGRFVTYDLKPDRSDPTAVGTRQMAEAIVEAMNA